MYDNELIQIAINDCLSGLQNQPSVRQRVLDRANGKRHPPQKLTLATAMVLLLTFLVASALAIGVFMGFFKIEQDKAGAFRSCVSTGDQLYLMTSEGFHVWQPGDERPTLLFSSEEWKKYGLSSDACLFTYHDAVGLFCQSSKTIWKYEKGELHFEMNCPWDAFDIENGKVDSVVYQDDWLFFKVLREDGTIYDSTIYRLRVPSGALERLALEGVLECCPFQPGEILAITSQTEANQSSLVTIDTASGTVKSTLYTTTLQGIEGIAYDAENQQIYALVKGALSKWNGEAWKEMQGYASHHLADSYAIVDHGFVSVSYDNVQYIPFAEKGSMPTLRIRGSITMGNTDADFQEQNPSVAVVRERDPALTVADVQKAIEAGDTTDLFHVKLDADLISMFEKGLFVPLSSSDILLRDAAEMASVFQEALLLDGQLFAVPSMASITVWSSENEFPHTFEEILRQHASQELYLSHQWAQEPWTMADYVDYLLTTYIAEATKMDGSVVFNTPSFRNALETLRSASLPVFAKESSKRAASTSVTVSLFAVPSEKWTLPCRISPEASPNIPVRLSVYVLNPHAENPDLALRYLEYMSTHRLPDVEAMLKPESAVPALHPGVQKQMEEIAKEQYAFDAEHGVATDEAALQARLDAIASDPASWAVAENRLAEYKEQIVPYLDLRISPLLCSSAKQEGGIYSEMKSTVMAFVEGKVTLEECITKLTKLASRL